MTKVEPSVYDGHQPEARLLEVVAVTFLRGEGDGPHNVLRRVTVYFAKDGTLLAENDPCAELLPKNRPDNWGQG